MPNTQANDLIERDCLDEMENGNPSYIRISVNKSKYGTYTYVSVVHFGGNLYRTQPNNVRIIVDGIQN